MHECIRIFSVFVHVLWWNLVLNFVVADTYSYPSCPTKAGCFNLHSLPRSAGSPCNTRRCRRQRRWSPWSWSWPYIPLLILSMPISDPNKIALVSVSSSVPNRKMQYLIAWQTKYIYICMIQYRLKTGNSKPISRVDNLGKKTKLKKLAHMFLALIDRFTNKSAQTKWINP